MLWGVPAASAVMSLPETALTTAPQAETTRLASLLYGFRFTGDTVLHPMSDAGEDLQWDASGGGCVDGGGWDDAFPSGKGDLRSPVFCIPQPCVALLSPAELAREIYGRPLRDGEYDTYLRRLEETCGEIPASPVNVDTARDIQELLRFASVNFVALQPSDAILFSETVGTPAVAETSVIDAVIRDVDGLAPRSFRAPLHLNTHSAMHAGARSSGSLRPRDFRLPLLPRSYGGSQARRPSNERVAGYLPNPRLFASGPKARRGSGPETARVREVPKVPKAPPSLFEPQPDPGPGATTTTPPSSTLGGDGHEALQPAPVPLPGGLLLLAAGLASFRFFRR